MSPSFVYPGRLIEVPASQPVQLPSPRGATTVLVANQDATATVDLANSLQFIDSQIFTLTAGQSANWPGGSPLYCRVTPGQTPAPVAVTVWAQPNGIAAPLAAVKTTPGTLSISTTSLPSGTVGQPYAATLTATGGVAPYAWSLASGSSLPAGLSLSSSGQITGTPTVANAYAFSVTVTDAQGSTATAPLSMMVAAGAGSVTFAYTGAQQSWVVPTGVTSIAVDMAGASGSSYAAAGGLGSRVQGTIAVTAGSTLTATVGGATAGASGGWGGGPGGQGGANAGGGGGGSVLQLASTILAAAAGGGGGTYGGVPGGSGGAEGASSAAGGGLPGTSEGPGAGGAAGVGGAAGSSGSSSTGGAGGATSTYGGGGGGGGYYGGGGGGSSSDSSGGGGGGGLSVAPSGGTITNAYQSGNGYITISWQ